MIGGWTSGLEEGRPVGFERGFGGSFPASLSDGNPPRLGPAACREVCPTTSPHQID